MTIFSKSGDKIYSITSPNSSYDNIELKFKLKKPTINIFKGKYLDCGTLSGYINSGIQISKGN